MDGARLRHWPKQVWISRWRNDNSPPGVAIRLVTTARCEPFASWRS